MFKQITFYAIQNPDSLDLTAIELAMKSAQFAGIGSMQEQALGWVPPRDEEGGPLVESISGHWLAQLRIDTRSVPAQAKKEQLTLLVEDFEKETGRKPNRKELQELKEQALDILLPKVLPKTSLIWVWIDPAAQTVGISTATQGKVDTTVTALIRSIEGLELKTSEDMARLSTAMGLWLGQEDGGQLPGDLQLGNACLLQAEDESKATARFTNQHLDCDAVRQNLLAGKVPRSIELVVRDRLTFALCDDGKFKQITFDGGLLAGANHERGQELDGTFTLMAGELAQLHRLISEHAKETLERADRHREASNQAIKGVAHMWGASGLSLDLAAA